jgi:hypothetical protein
MITNKFAFPAAITFCVINRRLILLIKKYCRARTGNFAHSAQVIQPSQTLGQNNRTQTSIHWHTLIQRLSFASLRTGTAKVTFSIIDSQRSLPSLDAYNADRARLCATSASITLLLKHRFGNGLRRTGNHARQQVRRRLCRLFNCLFAR